MPISLRVKLQKETITISELLPKVSAALQEILGLTQPPTVVAEKWVDGQPTSSRPETTSTKDGMVSFSIPGDPDIAYLHCYLRGVHEPGDEATPQAGVVVGSGRKPLDFALAAAVAAAVARENNSDVVDDTPFFSEALDQSAELFIESIRVKRAFVDYRDAAQAFVKDLYGRRKPEKGPA